VSEASSVYLCVWGDMCECVCVCECVGVFENNLFVCVSECVSVCVSWGLCIYVFG
jgi:hypothetical protein